MGGVEIDYRKYNILLCDELLYLGRQKRDLHGGLAYEVGSSGCWRRVDLRYQYDIDR